MHILLFVFLQFLSSVAQVDRPSRIALTFDDLVYSGPHSGTEHIEQVNNRILDTLERFQAPAVGFVNENKLESSDRERRTAVLERWLQQGHELGNHTYSHPDLHTTELEPYLRNCLEGEKTVRSLLEKRGENLRWFRHPYLHTGRTLEIKEAVENWLAERGIRVAPVTIDNAEYIYNRAYTEALRREGRAAADRVATAYIAYMLEMVEFYRSASTRLFGRQIDQILLLHVNDINAACLDELLVALTAAGHTFITLETALKDAAYSSEDRWTGSAGVSWLFRWDWSAGKTFDWRKEPRVEPFVMQLYDADRADRSR